MFFGCPWDSKWLVLSGPRLKIGTLGAKMHPAGDLDRFSPPAEETLRDTKGARRGPKALTRGVSRGIQNQTPKMNHFGTPPGGAQVSSRLGESTVFKISGGSLLGPILAPFWDPFGTPGGHFARQEGPRGPKRGSKRGYQKGIVF